MTQPEYTILANPAKAAPLPKVRLNVGGKLFSAANTFLVALQIDLTTLFVIRSGTSARVTYFLDRDPYYFRKVIALIKKCDGTITNEVIQSQSQAMLAELHRYGLADLDSIPDYSIQVHTKESPFKAPGNLIKICAPDSSFTVRDRTLASSHYLASAVQSDHEIHLDQSSGAIRILINALRLGIARPKHLSLLTKYGVSYWQDGILHHPPRSSVPSKPASPQLVTLLDQHLSQVRRRGDSVSLWRDVPTSREQYLEQSDRVASSKYVTTAIIPGNHRGQLSKMITRMVVSFPSGTIGDLEQILVYSGDDSDHASAIASWTRPQKSHLRKIAQMLQPTKNTGSVRGQLDLLLELSGRSSAIPNQEALSVQFHSTRSVIKPQLSIQESWFILDHTERAGFWKTDHLDQTWLTSQHFRTTVSHPLSSYRGVRDLVCYLTINDQIYGSSLQELWVGRSGSQFGDPNNLVSLVGSKVGLLDDLGYYQYCFAPEHRSLAGLLRGEDLQLYLTWQTDDRVIDPFPGNAVVTSHLVTTRWSTCS